MFLSTYLMLNIISCTNQNIQNTDTVSIVQDSLNEQFGFDANHHFYNSITVKPNQFLSEILYDKGFSIKEITSLEQNAKDIFDIRKIRAGKDLTFVHLDSCSAPCCMIYEPNAFKYIRYHLEGESCIEIIEKEITTELNLFEGEVESSLWDALIKKGHTPSIIDKLEDAFASSVDFYHVQKCDGFKFLYEKLFVEGEFVGYGNVHGAYFTNAQGKHYAIYYEKR